MSYWGNADRFIYGELPDGHPGHDIEEIYAMILKDQKKNEKKYGRRIGMYVIAEGTRVMGIESADKKLIDAHGHHKLNPEALVSSLKRELEVRYKLKTQTVGITYEMRNSPPTEQDIEYAEVSADVIADAVIKGNHSVESTFEIIDGRVYAGIAPIRKVSEKRFALYYPGRLIDYENFQVTDEIGEYYRALFGSRKNLRNWLPGKPKKINVFDLGAN
ncbi:MAG: hypothetical protein Q8N99_01750 [Nanoarchaeota archaeon]|nr:hypothetical protein [Nanoarchaeota archaeon]